MHWSLYILWFACSQIFYVRNFHVTIFSSISHVHHIFAMYNTTGKQYSCKKFFVVLGGTKILTTEISQIMIIL